MPRTRSATASTTRRQRTTQRSELTDIGSALGSLTGGRRGQGRRGSTAVTPAEAKPRRTRKPITDPAVLARRSAALAKARAARAERLAAARAGAD